MKNAYEIRGDTTVIFLDSEKYGRIETLISTADLPRAQEFLGAWFPNWHRGTRSFYVRGKVRMPDGSYKSVSLHRWILRIDDPALCVDHVMHDTLDNCRWALNLVSQADNAQNITRSKRNKSGYPGVSWISRLHKWKAHIRTNYKLIHLGYYATKVEAIAARREAELTYHRYKAKIN